MGHLISGAIHFVLLHHIRTLVGIGLVVFIILFRSPTCRTWVKKPKVILYSKKGTVFIFWMLLIFFLGLTIIPCFLDQLIILEDASFNCTINSSIVSISRGLLDGQPAYSALGSENRYSLLYGPSIYWITALFMKLMPGLTHDLAARVGSVFLWITSLSIAGYVSQKLIKASKLESYFIGITLLWGFFYFISFNCLNRVEVVLFASVSWIFLSLVIPNPILAVVFASVGLGVAYNAKIHGMIYCLPALYLFFQKKGAKLTSATVFFSLLVFMCPFLFSHHFPLENYLQWLVVAQRHPKLFSGFISTFLVALLMFFPVILSTINQKYSEKKTPPFLNVLFVAFLGVSIFIACIVASKSGAGRYHLFPFLPYMALVITAVIRPLWSTKYRVLLIMWMIVIYGTAIDLALKQANYFFILYQKRESRLLIHHELDQIKNKYAHQKVMMGYGEDGTCFREFFYDMNHENFVDYAALSDMSLARIEIPQASVDKLKRGDYKVIVIPRHHVPFALLNSYSTYRKPLFSAEWKAAFQAYYFLKESTPSFDIYVSKNLGHQ